MQKKAIVTGGLGFIGSNLIKLLIKKSFFVINIDKASYASNIYNLKDIIKKNNYKFYKSDICNKKMLSMILRKHKPNILFNLAAETHVDRSINNSTNFVRSNIVGVHNILECIKKYIKIQKNFRMIHVSTDEVYGDLKGLKKSKEGDKYQPSSPYSASKASADHLINSYVRTYKLPILISNCCNNFGPCQFPEKLIPKTIFSLITNKNIPIYGKGINQREWIFVEDHCEGLLKIFKKGKIGESYNIGSNYVLSNLNLIKKIMKIYYSVYKKKTQKVKIQFIKDRPGHDLRYALNSNKIKRELKWKLNTDLNKGLSETIKWYCENQKFFGKSKSRIFNKRFGLIND